MNRLGAGVIAGGVAGLVMAMAMMGDMKWQGQNVWTNPNLIAAMWMGPKVAGGRLTLATLVGFHDSHGDERCYGDNHHPFIYKVPAWRTLLAALSYAMGSYPFAFAIVMTWANPIMVERTGLVPMAAAHALFGLVLGFGYLLLRRRHTEVSEH